METIVITRTTAKNGRRFLQAVLLLGAIGLALAQNTCGGQPRIRCTMQSSMSSDAIGNFVPMGMPRVVPGAPMNACAVQITRQGLPMYPPPAPPMTTPDPRLLLLGFEPFAPSPTDPNQSNIPSSISLKAEWIGDRIQDAQVNASVDAVYIPDAAERAALANYPYGTSTPPPNPPADPTNPNRPYSFGTFDHVYPDANDICTATLATSEMDYPRIGAHQVLVSIPSDGSYVSTMPDGTPGGQSDVPKTHVRFEWSNFRAIVSTQSLGLEAFANVTITRDGCQADYQVSILSPRVPCTMLDAMGNAILPGTADPSLCNPNAAPKNPFGSGIHPGIPVSCQQVGFDPMSPDFECMPTKMTP
jgi:hypothetical protein